MYNISMSDTLSNSKTNIKILVIGAGASGIMAAGIAAQSGATVKLLEKNSSPARKLSLTGNGRCNITNMASLSEFPKHYHSPPRFLRHALHSFSNVDVINFFERLGIIFHQEDNGRVLPVNSNGQEISNIYSKWAVNQGVHIIPNIQVTKLLTANNQITGILAIDSANQEIEIKADAVIIATGGKSYPKTGSTGDGYGLAAELGHSIIAPRPALVPIEIYGDLTKRLQGVSLSDVAVTIWINNKKVKTETGDMIFTHYGVSGPMILNLSRIIVDALMELKDVNLTIDLIPKHDHQEIHQEMMVYIKNHNKKLFKNLISNYLQRKMVSVCCEELNFIGDKFLHQISSQELKRLRIWLKALTLKVSNYRSFDEAMVTAGGVDTNEVNDKTMESKLVKGLYLSGEVLDIDGETGGYNLQAAFSTGWLAGKSCVK